MKRIRMVLAMLPALVFCLVGCRVDQVDMSSDGKYFAVATSGGLRVSTTDQRSSEWVVKGACDAPQFSPDGKRIAVRANNGGLILDLKTRAKHRLPTDIQPPYAWSPNGRELLGWRGEKRAIVLSTSNFKALRAMNLDRPSEVLWTGPKEMGLAYTDRVVYWKAGTATSFKSQLGQVANLTGGAGSLTWMEFDPKEMEDFESGHHVIRCLETRSGDVQTLWETIDSHELVPEGNPMLLSQTSVSPDRSKLMYIGWVDLSPSGTLSQLLLLEKRISKGGKNVDPALRSQERALEAKVRLRMLVGQLRLSDGKATVLRQSPIFGLPNFEAGVAAKGGTQSKESVQAMKTWNADMQKQMPKGFPHDIRWSSDGKVAAIAYTQGYEIVHLN